jgi:hypothetical protein
MVGNRRIFESGSPRTYLRVHNYHYKSGSACWNMIMCSTLKVRSCHVRNFDRIVWNWSPAHMLTGDGFCKSFHCRWARRSRLSAPEFKGSPLRFVSDHNAIRGLCTAWQMKHCHEVSRAEVSCPVFPAPSPYHAFHPPFYEYIPCTLSKRRETDVLYSH